MHNTSCVTSDQEAKHIYYNMFYEASHNEYSIGKFIEHYQNAMPQLVMIRRG